MTLNPESPDHSGDSRKIADHGDCPLTGQSIFINGFLWGIESWYNLTNKEVEELEAIDKILLRRILSVPVSVPTALIYLELGIVPLKYIIQARRIMFLQYILKRKSDDLLRKFFEAKCRKSSKNFKQNPSVGLKRKILSSITQD